MMHFRQGPWLRAGLLLGLCLFAGPAFGKRAPPPTAVVQVAPNLYVLKGGSIEVTYSTSGIDGRPHFTYKEGQNALSFKGDEIRTQQTEIGTLVSVSIKRTVDAGSTTFTLILPRSASTLPARRSSAPRASPPSTTSRRSRTSTRDSLPPTNQPPSTAPQSTSCSELLSWTGTVSISISRLSP